MCLGVPAQVVELADASSEQIVKVNISGVHRDVSIDLLDADELNLGDWVLVHVGFALSKIDAQEAAITLDQIKKLGGNTFEDELDAFAGSVIR
ncbi:HypC/HybG/HupF family hydrogenase formation chaperone [Arcanobacterium hippocoleae]